MTGLDRVLRAFGGEHRGGAAVLPMVHTGLAANAGVPLGRFFSDAEAMAGVMVEGYRRFGFDGVQLSLGVTGEAEALGAAVSQPPDGAPVLREHLLADAAAIDDLRRRDPCSGGRMPLFFDAVRRVSQEIGGEAFILATLRGPTVIASQLRGIEDALVDMIEQPELLDRVLSLATEVALQVAKPTLDAGAHGLLLGEATCSPNFISPDFYRRLIQPHHRRLVAGLKKMGWRHVGLHICGNITPIIEDIIATGVAFFDVDYQVPADRAVELVRDRVALRGNLDPSAVLRFGTPEQVAAATDALRKAVAGSRWIMCSGCDIPPGTPPENLDAFVERCRVETGA